MAEETKFTETKTVDRTQKDKDPDEAEKDLVKKWTKIIEDLESDNEAHFTTIKDNREKVKGKLHSDKTREGTVRVNLTHAHIKRSVNRTYARNPEFAIRPTQFVNPASVKMWRLFGMTAEIVLDRVFKTTGLKRRAKSCLRAAKTSRVGWLKVRWQQDVETDGNVITKIRDGKAKLAQLEYLMRQTEDPDERTSVDGDIRELNEMLEVLEQEQDFVAYHGLVLDVVSPDNILLPIKQLLNFDEYINSPYIIEKIWKTKVEVEKKHGDLPVGTSLFNDRVQKAVKDEPKRDTEEGDLVLLYEIWDADNERVRVLPKGGDRFLSNFIPEKLGTRWYPYFGLAQNPIEGQWEPVSDVELVWELADEINNSLTKFRDHRALAVPHWVGDGDIVTEKEIKRFSHPILGEVTLVSGQQGRRLDEIFMPAKYPPIDPQVYVTAHLEAAMEKVAGGGEVTNPKSNRSRTLGEAKELAADTGVNVSADTDEIEDWFEDVAQYCLEILLQRITIEDVEKIAGPRYTPVMGPPTEQFPEGQPTGKLNDGAMWPTLEPEEIFNNVHFIIKAGSSGKPGRQEETQLWTQYLMPRMTELVAGIGELRQNGSRAEADSLLFIAQETLRRVDPFFDIHEFAPDPEPPTKEEQLAQAQQIELAKLELQKLNAETEKIQAETGRIAAEIEKKKLDTEKVKEDIESQNIDDVVKVKTADMEGAKAVEESRIKDRELAMKSEELDLKEEELRIKDKEINLKAAQAATGGSDGNGQK